MTQCIPIRDLKNTAEISEMCRKSNSPITITKNGYSDMVIMSTEVYERMRLYSVYEKLMQAEDDITEGRVSDAHSNHRQSCCMTRSTVRTANFPTMCASS